MPEDISNLLAHWGTEGGTVALLGLIIVWLMRQLEKAHTRLEEANHQTVELSKRALDMLDRLMRVAGDE